MACMEHLPATRAGWLSTTLRTRASATETRQPATDIGNPSHRTETIVNGTMTAERRHTDGWRARSRAATSVCGSWMRAVFGTVAAGAGPVVTGVGSSG